jgi:hypothetical protein
VNRLPERASWYHPASGAAILSVDWVCFGAEWTLGPVTTAVMSLAAFAAAFSAVYAAQTRLAGDPPATARVKALLGGLAAGVPFPVTGTIVGAAILALSGLRGRK